MKKIIDYTDSDSSDSQIKKKYLVDKSPSNKIEKNDNFNQKFGDNGDKDPKIILNNDKTQGNNKFIEKIDSNDSKQDKKYIVVNESNKFLDQKEFDVCNEEFSESTAKNKKKREFLDISFLELKKIKQENFEQKKIFSGEILLICNKKRDNLKDEDEKLPDFLKIKKLFKNFIDCCKKENKKKGFIDLNTDIKLYVNTLPKLENLNDSWMIFIVVLTKLLRGLILQLLSEQFPSCIEKIKVKFEALLPFFENINKMTNNSNFSLITHYFLSLVSNPLADTFDNDFSYFRLLLKEKNRSNLLDLSLNLKNKIKALATSNASLVIYHKIDNCYGEVSQDLEQTKLHIENLLDSILNKKIFLLDQISDGDNAETTFDCSIYISRTYGEFISLDDCSTDIFQKHFSNLCMIILHEISHAKRIKYASKNYFFKHSPKNLEEEAGVFFENSLFGVEQILKDEESKEFLDEENWKKLGDLRNKLLEIAKSRNCFNLKKKKKGIRCQTSRHVINPEFKFMIQDAYEENFF